MVGVKIPVFCLAIWLFSQNTWAFEVPPRRRAKEQTTPGHVLTPAVANIPGVGFTYGLLGSYTMVLDFQYPWSVF